MKKVGYSHIYADIYFILHDIAKEKKKSHQSIK